MRMRLLLPLIAIYATACATGGQGTSQAKADAYGAEFAAMLRTSEESSDAKAFRDDLEAVYEQILSRNRPQKMTIVIPGERPAIPVVDIEAAISIPIPEHRTINSAVRLFSGDLKDKIQDSLIRSGHYRPLIDRALEEFDLPKGLAYLPVIESAYLPTVTSRAGAAGIWQFMPETAREYGLRVDWWVDERADPERSTRAAAKYLRYLYDRFQDWPLTLAAYNGGPNRVQRTLNEQGVSSFWELLERGALPKETRGYVPTFFATLLIASEPDAYGFELGTPEHADDRQIDLRGPVSLAYIAEVAGIDEKELRSMNPGLRRGVVPPGECHIHVPAHVADTILARADRLSQEDAGLKFSAYTVRKGETLAKIARAIGSNEETLLAMNGLSSAKSVHAGQRIYVPARAREVGTLIAHGRDRDFFHVVKKGDTLYSIARKNGLSVSELRDLNELSSGATIHVGQKLRITVPRTATGGM
jgi:membrane-bound lytic murein transglycosylase D